MIELITVKLVSNLLYSAIKGYLCFFFYKVTVMNCHCFCWLFFQITAFAYYLTIFTVSKWSTPYHKVDSAMNIILWMTDNDSRAIQGENDNEMQYSLSE